MLHHANGTNEHYYMMRPTCQIVRDAARLLRVFMLQWMLHVWINLFNLFDNVECNRLTQRGVVLQLFIVWFINIYFHCLWIVLRVKYAVRQFYHDLLTCGVSKRNFTFAVFALTNLLFGTQFQSHNVMLINERIRKPVKLKCHNICTRQGFHTRLINCFTRIFHSHTYCRAGNNVSYLDSRLHLHKGSRSNCLLERDNKYIPPGSYASCRGKVFCRCGEHLLASQEMGYFLRL